MAAVNNAALCDAVCRTHGIDGTTGDGAWTSRARTPALYPDAVTLVPECTVPALLARIDASPGCSIKDSFASLDLAPYGFTALFDAEWIARAPTPVDAVDASDQWTVVRDADGFAAWERAWRGGGGQRDVLRPELLRERSVTVIAARAGERVVAGAILNRSPGVVGISNVFSVGDRSATCWYGCVAFAASLFPHATFVGYESGDALVAARALGFDASGPLRVWLFEDPDGVGE